MIGIKRRLDVRVVFQGSQFGGFWSLWCRRGWRHVLLLVTIYFPEAGIFSRRYTMKIEPTAWGVDVDVVWRDPAVLAKAFLDAGATAVIKTTVDIPPKKLFAFRGMISCVSVVKAVLVIRDWKVITPLDLARYLVRHGGRFETFDESDHDDDPI